ncbi:MAG: type II toxin-antitoxin system Phd/YefM family antitoxin [Azospirillaceae bacterium]
MKTGNPADAKAHPSEHVDRVEAGDSTGINRRGKPVARRTATDRHRQRVDVSRLGALTETMPRADQDAEELVRSMRDTDRY